MDNNSNERPGDLTGGLGRTDAGFADAEARIRAKIAAEIDINGAPASPVAAEAEPAPTAYVAPEPRHTRRPVLAFGAVVVVLLAALGGLLVARSSNSSTTLAEAAADHPSATGTGPATISSRWIERRDGAVIARDSVLVIDGDNVTETRTAETAVEGQGAALAGASTKAVPARTVLGGFSLTEAAELPTDPDELTAAVTERLGSGRDASSAAAALASIAAVERVPAPVRAAAVAALESISEPPVDGTDPEGRTGALLRGDSWAAIVDRSTGLVLAFANDPSSESPSAAGDAGWWLAWM